MHVSAESPLCQLGLGLFGGFCGSSRADGGSESGNKLEKRDYMIVESLEVEGLDLFEDALRLIEDMPGLPQLDALNSNLAKANVRIA